MATQTIDTTLFASTHPDIAKRTSISGIILSAVMMLIGIALFMFIFQMGDKSSTVSMALMVLGSALILFSIFRLFWKSKEIIYLPTGSVAKECSFFFDLKYMNRLIDMIEQGELDAENSVKSDPSGNVRMDAVISRDNKFAAVQLFQFVPYSYTPVTTVCYFNGKEAAAVSTFLLKCKV